ncbi:MAG TPA: circadian clock KaiB family protein [Solirubrobacteraceae bacterium]|jgi:circadian clock protein KaiB
MGSSTLLRLYVVGGTQASERALHSAERLRADLAGEAELEVVDLAHDPELAERERIVATPLLVRLSPEPVRRIVGDLSDVERVRWSLGLPRRESA